MDEDFEAKMNRLVRDRAVAPLDLTSLGLAPQERRSWWEFCLWMHEFLSNVLKDRLVSRYQAEQLSRLSWIVLKGTYVFATGDPMMGGEQRRFVELCEIIGAAFPVIVDDLQGMQDGFKHAFGLDRFWPNGKSKEPSEAQALMENRLQWWKDWENDPSPIAWVKKCAWGIHQRDHTQGGYIPPTDALHSTPKKKRDQVYSGGIARDVMPLEHVKDLAGVANYALPNWTWMSVPTLIAAVQDDGDLRVYTELRVKGYKPRPAWERLGWETKRGQAVDRRYRRVREKLKASGFEYQGRDIELGPGVSDASCTVVMERIRIPVNPRSEGTLSGRVVYDPRTGGERFKRTD